MDIGSKTNSAYLTLRIALGVGVLLAGLDKFFNILTNWGMYLSSMAERLLPVGPHAFMLAVGVIEAVVGLAMLTRWTRIAAYVAAIWLVLIAVNLVSTRMFYDLAVRDVEMAVAAFALARLSEARAMARSAARAPEGSARPGLAA